MTAENHDENCGLEPAVAEDLRRRAATVVQGLVQGDPEAERTLQQLQFVVGMATKDFRESPNPNDGR